MPRRLIGLFLISLAAAALLYGSAGSQDAAQAPTTRPSSSVAADALDQSLKRWKDAYAVPAASAVIMDGATLVRGLDYGRSFDKPYPIASLSKAITAVCLAQLVDQGRLSFDDTLGAVLSEEFAKLGEPTDPRMKQITVAELLTHTAGLKRNAFGPAKTLRDAFKVAIKTPLDADPGGAFNYSNTGYLLLGVVIEDVSGEPYEKECGKTLSRFGAAGVIDPKMPQRAANGGWDVSALDYGKFLQAFDLPSPILGPTSQNWLLSRPTSGSTPSYALGVKVKKTGRGVEFLHNGEVASGEGGGSYFLKADNGYVAVVLFAYDGTLSGEGYADLFSAMKSALVSGKAHEPSGSAAAH